jgi:sugar O-acyltransferase (sialic acid O-acetyltransferase NeuD family)
MIVIGAKGFAKEILEIFHLNNQTEDLVFFDNISDDIELKLYDKYRILRSWDEVEVEFTRKNNRSFTIAVGGPINRRKLYNKMIELGGEYCSTISPNSIIGHYDIKLGNGSNIMSSTFISNSVKLGIGVVVNVNATVGHDCSIGEFTEISPGVNISGNCHIGSLTTIGTNATILPKVNIGNNVVIAAGSMVKNDIPDNTVAVGYPARVVSKNEEIL